MQSKADHRQPRFRHHNRQSKPACRQGAGLALTAKYQVIFQALEIHFRVIKAILLRDMRTRFGRSHLTYLVAIGWPLSHLILIVVAFIVVNRVLPFGNDSVIYIATGALPYILCLYPARMMAMTFVQNVAVLQLPIIQPIDLIIARMILESLTAFIVAMVFVFGLWAFAVDIMPVDLPTALTAIYTSVFFGLSIGTFTVVLRALFKTPGYLVLILLMIGSYLSSGVTVPLTPTSETTRTFIGLNPIYNLVQWSRSAFFETHTAVPVDKPYILLLSAALLALGLMGERVFRGKIITL
jgi:capsular polysaccharide transport system permease protein